MSPRTDSKKAQMVDKPYRPILGSVMWGQLATRPDLSFAVSLLSRFQANPGIEHWQALMHVVGYIKNTMDYIRKMRNYLSQLKCLNALF